MNTMTGELLANWTSPPDTAIILIGFLCVMAVIFAILHSKKSHEIDCKKLGVKVKICRTTSCQFFGECQCKFNPHKF